MMQRQCAMLAAAVAVASMLSGCLEVDQHPAYANGQYAGKHDNRAADTSFKGDSAALNAALAARTKTQNEYNRANP